MDYHKLERILDCQFSIKEHLSWQLWDLPMRTVRLLIKVMSFLWNIDC